MWYDFGRDDNGRFIQPGKVHIGEFFKGWKCALWKNHISANGTFGDIRCMFVPLLQREHNTFTKPRDIRQDPAVNGLKGHSHEP